MVAFVAVAGHVAAASAAPLTPLPSHHNLGPPGCNQRTDNGYAPPQSCAGTPSQAATSDDPLRLSLPPGSRPCPDSGPGAACNAGESSPAPTTAGVSSVPAGMAPCPSRPGSSRLSAPGSCTDTALPAPQQPEALSPSGAPRQLRATPSVPSWTLSASVIPQRLLLTSNTSSLQPGQAAILTATASASMTGSRSAIEIFDQTTGTLVGACMQASQCAVAYAAQSGLHTFGAYITPPSVTQPANNAVASNSAAVAWFSVTLAASAASIVGPGKAVTFTATAPADVGSMGYQLGLYDQVSGSRLTYCSRGTTCTTTMTKAQAGTRSIVAYVAGPAETLPPPAIQAQSAALTETWMGVTLDAGGMVPQLDGTVVMRATANIDVTATPWSIGIYDQQGDLVADACKSGAFCSATVKLKPVSGEALPFFTAVIGAARQPLDESAPLLQLVRTVQTRASLVNIQARSIPVQPTTLFWGVDSCKPLTGDPTAAGGLYAQVGRWYGSPDFWGRYLTNTDNCPGISTTEIAAAAYRKMGILPIYNNYDCSAVTGYQTGLRYASEAVAAGAVLGIPPGSVLAIDIEPPGDQCPGAASVDAGFIEGWYDGITIAGYVPLYYGNGTAGSEFGSAWCRAGVDRPDIAQSSYLWTFEPSLTGRFTKGNSPAYALQTPGCAANVAAWQYMLSGGAPDVDSDEALSKLPLWFPQAGA